MGTSEYSVAISAAIALMSEPPAAEPRRTAVIRFRSL